MYNDNKMRRMMNNKQNSQLPAVKRTNSHANFTYTQSKTIAQINRVSAKNHVPKYHTCKPCRILLPDYFNIPKFEDRFFFVSNEECSQQELMSKLKSQLAVRRKLKDLQILAQGMRRAKNIKQESRYYFTQAVLYHNNGMYESSVGSLQKFLKIVLFIRDQKSVELALNAIGTEFMYLKSYEKAIEYHKKQREIGERADHFPSHVNCGLTYQMKQDYESALKEYQQAQRIQNIDNNPSRKSLLQRLIQRVGEKVSDMFVTQNGRQNISVAKNIFRNKVKLNPLQITKNQSHEQSKIEMAIYSAEQGMDDHLLMMKQSLVLDQDD